MSEIVRVPFHGDEVHAIQQGEDVWVPLKRVCERLGLDANGQRQRLSRQPWARACVMHAQDASGRNQEVFCLHLDCVPMWLATIQTSRVSPEHRAKLALYQRECARVLRDHFFRAPAGPSREEFQALATVVAGLVTAVEHLTSQTAFLQRHLATGGMISPDRLTQLRRDVRSLAVLELAAGRWSSKRAASADIYREMGETTGWGGKGRGYDTLPANLEPAAASVIRRRRKDVERALLRRQLELPTPTHH